MENFKLIDMLDQLDASILEDLQLEKDFKNRHQGWCVKCASLVAALSLLFTGCMVWLLRNKKRAYQRRVV